MMIADLPFRDVWAVDFEFSAPGGEHPKPICLVARELKTGRTIRQWEDEFGPLPPYLYPLRSNLTGCDGGGVVSERRH